MDHEVPYRQPCVQINYPDRHDYTRSVEIKHVTGQEHPATVVTYEYPSAQGEPFYPVLTPQSRRLYGAYRQLAREEERSRRVYLAGRLGRFTYINSDVAIERAQALFGRIVDDWQSADGGSRGERR